VSVAEKNFTVLDKNKMSQKDRRIIRFYKADKYKYNSDGTVKLCLNKYEIYTQFIKALNKTS